MRFTFKKIILSFIFLVFLFVPFSGISAETDEERLQKLNDQIKEYESQISALQAQASTLSNQVAQFNAQIKLTELKISQTQEQILLLGGRIDQLTLSLDNLNDAFSSRAVETYKMARTDNYATILLTDNLSEVVSRYYYLQKIQESDRSLLARLQEAQNTYQEQKVDLEELEQVLGTQKEALDSQKAAKANLLQVTKNNEQKYQSLLAQVKAEFEAIQAIIAGRGDETEVGHVNEGQRIASIIQGPSCNSSGSHLHFIVARGGNTENPFSYLRNDISYRNCSGPGECSDGDPFNPSGSWIWPVNPTVKLTQGYGTTWAVQNTWVGRIYNFHNGIDIDSEGSSEIKAVRSGTLYQGSYSGYNGCRLRYVRVDHDENDIETYYLHINY